MRVFLSELFKVVFFYFEKHWLGSVLTVLSTLHLLPFTEILCLKLLFSYKTFYRFFTNAISYATCNVGFYNGSMNIHDKSIKLKYIEHHRLQKYNHLQRSLNIQTPLSDLRVLCSTWQLCLSHDIYMSPKGNGT